MIRIFEHYIEGEKVYFNVVDPVCKKYGLTHMEFNIIMFLYNNPRFDTASEICRYRKLTKSHVSISIQSLMDKHLISKEYEGNNKKTIHLRLLDIANVIARAGRIKQDEFKSIVLKGFTPSEVESLYSFINRIDNNIKDF